MAKTVVLTLTPVGDKRASDVVLADFNANKPFLSNGYTTDHGAGGLVTKADLTALGIGYVDFWGWGRYLGGTAWGTKSVRPYGDDPWGWKPAKGAA